MPWHSRLFQRFRWQQIGGSSHRCREAEHMPRYRQTATQLRDRCHCRHQSRPRVCRRGERNASSFSEKTSGTDSLLRLFLVSSVEPCQGISNLTVVGLQFQGSSEFSFVLVDGARSAIEHPKMFVHLRALATISAEVNRPV